MVQPVHVPVNTRLMMAALIAAVRTARFEDREWRGGASPRMVAAIANSLWLADRICGYAEQQQQEWFRSSSERSSTPARHRSPEEA